MRVGCQWAMYAEHKKHRHPVPAKHCLAQRTERHGSWIQTKHHYRRVRQGLICYV